MPDIIEIGSSPEVKQCRKPRSLGPILSSDDFNTSVFDDDEWLSIRPPKRRRANSLNRSTNNTLGDIYNSLPPRLNEQERLPISKSIVVAETNHTAYIDLSLESAFSDEIVFTSSAPELQSTKKSTIQHSNRVQADDDLNIWDDEIFSSSQPLTTSKHLSTRTATVLANISSHSVSTSTNIKTDTISHQRFRQAQRGMNDSGSLGGKPLQLYAENIDPSSTDDPACSDERAHMDKDAKAAAKAAERAAAKAAKEAAKQEAKEERRIAKEQKARDKKLAADIAEVNKAKWDKKISISEMILDLPKSIEGSSVGNQSIEFMRRLGVETTVYDSNISPGNVIRWKRKVKAEFDEEEAQWKPVSGRIEDEKHVLCHMDANVFVGLVMQKNTQETSADHEDLDLHLTKLNRQNPDSKLIFLIEGLNAWLRKNRNNRNRAYQTAVRGEENQAQNTRKRKQAPTNYVDEDVIEEALLQLQINHHSLIYQTTCPSDSAEWIKNFTEHISTVPYRQERMNAQSNAAFCMDVGQVRTGDNALDTYVRMLQEVQRLTPAMAYGIANLYPNLQALITAFKQHGPGLLEDVKKSANKNGGVTEARLGPAISKRLFKVLLGTNPSSTDV